MVDYLVDEKVVLKVDVMEQWKDWRWVE